MLDTEISVADIDLSDPAFWALPRDHRNAAFDVLRREAPVSWQRPPLAWAMPGDYPPMPGYWAVVRNADVRAVGRDTRRFTTTQGVSPYDNRDGEDRMLIESWMCLDPPEVHKFRGIFSKAFAPRMIRSLEGRIHTAIRDAIGRIANRGECDFFWELTHDFPITVICDMLGIPESDRAHFTHTMDVGMGGYGSGGNRESIDAIRELNEYGSELARYRRRHPADDLVSALAVAEVDGESLSDRDLGSSFFNIASGGMETTGTAAAHSLINLSRHPDERRRWQENYDALAPTAIEELLRWAPVVICFRRVARVDTELGGQSIVAGDHLYMFYPAANFDETVFDEPYKFDLGRDPNPHVSFGHGPHFCIGNVLARMELRFFYRELFQLLPDIDLAGEPVYAGHPFLDALESLPCTYTPNPHAAAG
jgi:hypothetical protein